MQFLELILRLLRWIQYRGYRRKISSIIKNKDIADFLLDPVEERYITRIKHKGLKGFDLNPLESLGAEITEQSINFPCAVKYHYLYWIVRQIYVAKKIFLDMIFYKDFTLCIDEEFIKWIGGKDFDKTVYIMYKIRDNLNKGVVHKPAGIEWREWEQELNYIRLYINFYTNNYSNCINFIVKGKDKYKSFKEFLIKGYEALKLYWRIFDC